MLIFGSAAILILLTVGVVLAYKYGAFSSSNFAKQKREDEKDHEFTVVKKLNDVQINNYKPMFFSTGLLISLLFTFFLITYTDVATYLNLVDDDELFLADDEIVTITEQNQPEPEAPKEKIKTPEIVETEEPIDTIKPIELDNELDDPEPVVPVFNTDPTPSPVENNTLYNLNDLQEIPAFIDGEFSTYISKNFNYPSRLLEEDEIINGRVFVSFVIEKDGSLSNVKIITNRGLHKLIDAEAIRVIKNSPKWTPGKNVGIPVRVKYIQPIRI